MPLSGGVLFINKSAKSKTLTRSEGAERKKIYCHVQQLPVSRTEHKALVLSCESCMISDEKLQDESRYPSRHIVDKDSSRCHRKQAKGPRKAKIHDGRERTKTRDPGRAPVSIMSLEASKLDPFSCSVVPIDERMTVVLKICTSPRPLNQQERLTPLHSLQLHDEQDLHCQIMGTCQSPQDPNICVRYSGAALRSAVCNN